MTDDEDRLRAVNRAFYDAFESADAATMQTLWSSERVVTCVHPRCCMLTGWDDVIASWGILFEDLPPLHFSVEERSLETHGDFGFITAVEEIRLQDEDDEEDGDEELDGDPFEGAEFEGDEEAIEDAGEGAGGGGGAEGEGDDLELSDGEEGGEAGEVAEEGDDEDGPRAVIATHVFFREATGWKLVHRHASTFSATDVRPSLPRSSGPAN